MVNTGGGTGTTDLWLLVGELTPAFTTWQQVGSPHEVVSGLYRLIYTCPNYTLIDSFGLLRVCHTLNGDKNTSPIRRIYPKPDFYVVSYPIPVPFRLAGIISQTFELKRILDRWQYRDNSQGWSIRIEQLNVEGDLNSTTFYLILDNLSIATDPSGQFYISTFTERVSHNGRDLREYNVGRFYVVDTGELYSDGFIDKNPYELICTFTSREPIQPGYLKVEISY